MAMVGVACSQVNWDAVERAVIVRREGAVIGRRHFVRGLRMLWSYRSGRGLVGIVSSGGYAIYSVGAWGWSREGYVCWVDCYGTSRLAEGET